MAHKSHSPLIASANSSAGRADRDEAEAIKRKGRAIRSRHDQLRDVAKVLKAERNRLGLSLTEAAARCGIAKANLSQLEKDLHPNPTVDTLLRYAQALGRDIENRPWPRLQRCVAPLRLRHRYPCIAATRGRTRQASAGPGGAHAEQTPASQQTILRICARITV